MGQSIDRSLELPYEFTCCGVIAVPNENPSISANYAADEFPLWDTTESLFSPLDKVLILFPLLHGEKYLTEH